MTNLNSKEYQLYLKDQQEDNLARSYDSQYLGLLEEWEPNIKALCSIPTTKVLDVGTRLFDSWDYFQHKYNLPIVGIDVCNETLEYCKQRNRDGYIPLDAHRMNEYFQPNQFDLVMAFHSFEHMYDLPMVLSHCFSVIKPGGYLFFALPIPSFNWGKGHWYDMPNEEAMINLTSSVGFKYIKHQLFRELEIRPEVEMVGLFRKE